MRYLERRSFVILVGTVGLGVVGLVLAGSRGLAEAPAVPPSAGTVTGPGAQRPGTDYVDLVGHTEAVETIAVRPAAPGLLSKILFQEGGEVRRGDLLFEFDARPQHASVALARAELTRAEAELSGAQADLARQKELSKTAAISQAETDKAAARLVVAKATVDAAKAKLEAAQGSLDATRITSPITGRVGQANVSAGNWIVPETVLAVIVSQDPIHVSFDIAEREYFSLARRWRQPDGTSSAKPSPIPVAVSLSMEQGFPRQGVVDFVDNRFDPKTGTIRVRAVLPNPDRLMLPGLFVRVRMPLEKPLQHP